MRWLLALLTLAYPLLIFAGLEWLDPRAIGILIGVVVVVRLIFARKRLFAVRRIVLLPAGTLLAILILSAATSNDARYLLVLPALVNAVLLFAFGLSLWRPPSMVEILARIQVETLSSEEVAYCRSVTGVWCAFFALNGTTIVVLSLVGSAAQWALYTGLVSYLLMGTLFAVEYVYRHYRFRRYVGALTDPALKKLFPPREASGGPS